MKRKTEEHPILRTEKQVLDLLRARYPSPGWAFFEKVGDGTGGNQRRSSDGLAMSLWPSRGLVLEGFEVKVSRSDLARELADPSKAEAVAQYCDHWWIVVGDRSIVTKDLPHTWGLLAPVSNRGHVELQVVKPAVDMTPKPIDRVFLAAILRRAAAHFDPQRIRQEVHGDVYQKILNDIAARDDESHATEIATLEKRIADVRSERDEARKAVLEIGMYDNRTVMQACQLLRWLNAWHPGARSVETAIATIASQVEALTGALESLGVVTALIETLRTRPIVPSDPACDEAATG